MSAAGPKRAIAPTEKQLAKDEQAVNQIADEVAVLVKGEADPGDDERDGKPHVAKDPHPADGLGETLTKLDQGGGEDEVVKKLEPRPSFSPTGPPVETRASEASDSAPACMLALRRPVRAEAWIGVGERARSETGTETMDEQA